MLQYSIQNCSSLSQSLPLRPNQLSACRQKHSNLGDRPSLPLGPSLAKPRHKQNYHDSQNDSIDTCESEQSLPQSKRRPNKLKVQLCKNYVEKGYCPYENRCRFAHGIEQLRAKDTFCSSELYRTRKCKIFFEKHECKFGERCNFMHDSRTVNEIVGVTRQLVKSALRSQFLQVGVACAANKGSSRLLSILQVERKSS